MDFEFVDDLEKEIAQYLQDYNQKSWAWSGTPGLGSFPEGAVSDDESQVWDWLSRLTKRNAINRRLAACENDCQRIKERDPLLIDKANDQLRRIGQLRLIMDRMATNPMYTKWNADNLSKGVELEILPNVRKTIVGNSESVGTNVRADVSGASASSSVISNNVFPCPSGTKWEDVRITLIDSETVWIETPSGKGRFHYAELKLNDRRMANKPNKLWYFLVGLAKNNGVISREKAGTTIPYDETLPDSAKRLNAHLRKLFEIKESIYKGHYKAKRGYHARIVFSDQTIVR